MLLDTVTFSDFTEDDCRGQSIGAVTKLVHVRQRYFTFRLLFLFSFNVYMRYAQEI